MRAREPHLPDQRRIRLLGEALRLWRGVPLAGLPGAWAERTRTAWTQERLETALAWAHALLGQGKSEEVPAVLRPLLTEHPLNEPLAVLLIRGLATSGRADAARQWSSRRVRAASRSAATSCRLVSSAA
ncbi:transcriptional activator domain-containing protein [Streptomyces sp. 1222.5]|uniref:AfsR/SARP family transcriptional regulator n=1 Tax=unclassified Streptomyces TaxID=2593676 RepID=UPI00089489A1|nr:MULTISPECIES: BTAD domain-containing putative transcriptional regulator [unclassified Streptomyces]PKW12337.1 transcriptional activator [Streptomyces sp. 5112.2]SEB58120.1 transcriptional activator domain-containing protein [Streptomyces sp. 1222.5]